MVDPRLLRGILPVTDIFAAQRGARDRQLLRGQAFTIRAVAEDGWAHGETLTDGYSGWIENADDLRRHPADAPTHRVVAAQSYAKDNSGLKTSGEVTPLSMGAELVVLDATDGWARIAWARGQADKDLFVPSQHLAPVDWLKSDPVAVAERLIGTPYLWGGNSALGIDCSGLVQIACHACGVNCPGDSDQQEAALGETLSPGTTPRRGDLLFWRGHVAWVADRDTLLHANAHHMAVAHEPLTKALARIVAQGEGPVTRHARLHVDPAS
nr:NlpC/P60 family protein [Lutimaribacter sp. EGI FJ00013]